MTLHERVSQWPRRKRGYAFFATLAVMYAIVFVVFRVAEPEITGSVSFWLAVVAEVVLVFGFAIAIAPPGKRWRTEP